MFRHKNTKKDKEDKKDEERDKEIKKIQKSDDTSDDVEEKKESDKKNDDVSEDGIKELLEKNLKWSQIIYEQNRRINHKLIWAAVAGWLRLVLILGPLIFAMFYLSPFIKQAWQSYNSLLGLTPQSATSNQVNSLESLFKVFNLNNSQQEQIKTILK